MPFRHARVVAGFDPHGTYRVGSLFWAKLRRLREQDRRSGREARRRAAASRRRARLIGVEAGPGGHHRLSSGEVAALLAVNPNTVARWATDESLPAIRTIGGHLRYRWADVAAWLSREV
jgi:excisionase family DNA binding protein